MKTIATPDHDLHFDSLAPAVPFSRRDFVATVVGAGFALAVQPVAAQQIITTDSAGLSAGALRIASENGEIAAYRSMPVGGKSLPVVLVISEIFGLHEYIRDTCRRLARQGYQAIAPNLFQRQGDPASVGSVAEILTTIVSRVPDAQVMGDLDACAAWAVANGGDARRLAITGFCWGGRITWLYAAHNPQLRAAVAWYGRLNGVPTDATPRHPIDVVGQMRAPVLGLYGAKDQGIPVADVEDMRQDMARAGKRAEFVIYPEAGHAFHADYRPSYRAEDAIDGWARLLAWFRDNGV